MRPERQLFDPRTADVVRAEQVPSRLLVFGVTSLVCGGLVAAAHHELPFLAHWTASCSADAYAYECEARGFYDAVAGVAGTGIFGAFCWLAHRLGPMRPTVTCTSCGVAGWVLDLEPQAGRCPRCAGDRFDYQIWFGSGTGLGPRIERVRETGVTGADLVRRFRETRKSATRRYY